VKIPLSNSCSRLTLICSTVRELGSSIIPTNLFLLEIMSPADLLCKLREEISQLRKSSVDLEFMGKSYLSLKAAPKEDRSC
jgi:hypothetical protein